VHQLDKWRTRCSRSLYNRSKTFSENRICCILRTSTEKYTKYKRKFIYVRKLIAAFTVFVFTELIIAKQYEVWRVKFPYRISLKLFEKLRNYVQRFIGAILWIVTVIVPVLPTRILDRQLFANNTYTIFYENPVRSLVLHIGSPKDEQKDGHTEGRGFPRRRCFWFRT
jgi:hypothetical protein